jgi:hypothetical protein
MTDPTTRLVFVTTSFNELPLDKWIDIYLELEPKPNPRLSIPDNGIPLTPKLYYEDGEEVILPENDAPPMNIKSQEERILLRSNGAYFNVALQTPSSHSIHKNRKFLLRVEMTNSTEECMIAPCVSPPFSVGLPRRRMTSTSPVDIVIDRLKDCVEDLSKLPR